MLLVWKHPVWWRERRSCGEPTHKGHVGPDRFDTRFDKARHCPLNSPVQAITHAIMNSEAVSALIAKSPSLKAARPKLEVLKKEVDVLKAEADKMPKPSADEEKKLKEKYEPELEKLMGELATEMIRIGSDPKLAAALGNAMSS